MSMTQRYAWMLRRHAGEWDKQGLPVQGECARQAARHMEEVQNRLNLNLDLFEAECRDGDELLRMLDLDPEAHRTEGGRLNLLKIRAALAERKTPNVCYPVPPVISERGQHAQPDDSASNGKSAQ